MRQQSLHIITTIITINIKHTIKKDYYDESGWHDGSPAGEPWHADTLYVVPYTTNIAKKVSQPSGGKPK